MPGILTGHFISKRGTKKPVTLITGESIKIHNVLESQHVMNMFNAGTFTKPL
ncbi:MAG TPA: hypothetical protein VMU83_07910 [Hanamia sp.]|nr:hypothetical protein [Hanamia sp.]